jgi:hypothetical protein
MGKLADKYSALQLAQIALVEAGSTPEQAMSAIINGADVESLAVKGRAKLDADEAEIARQVYEASPEGRLAAGKAALAAEAEREENVTAARALLRARGDALVDDYDDDTALDVSGIQPRPADAPRTSTLQAEALAARDARFAAAMGGGSDA